jgi:hypothetical protein
MSNKSIDQETLLETIRFHVENNAVTQAALTKYIHVTTGTGLKRIRTAIKKLQENDIISKTPQLLDMRTGILRCLEDNIKEEITC